ncbi:Hypothetical protein A7982_04146 [Minicystis rosea]|nr:Hypothetical protein A7982_04146 [Minicystis rosea]
MSLMVEDPSFGDPSRACRWQPARRSRYDGVDVATHHEGLVPPGPRKA